MHKKICFALVFFVLFALPIYATDAPQPGITPDNAILWKLDVLTERFLTAITLDQEEKVRKSLQSAEERLTEMAKMLRKDKFWAAEKAAQQQVDVLENARTYIVYLDHAKTETLFEQVFVIENALQNYAALVSEEQKQLIASSLDAEKEALVNTTFTSLEEHQRELGKELQKKKEETILKLRANGLGIGEIATLETTILQKIQGTGNDSVSSLTAVAEQGGDFLDILFENQTATQGFVSEAEDVVQDVVSDIHEYIDAESEKSISIQTGENTAVIADTSSKSKVKIEGELSIAQQALIEEIYASLKEEETKAEIEIEVVELREEVWRIEKEVDGILSKDQQRILDDLLLSLGKEPAQLRIKIKHDPAAFSAKEEVLVGENQETGDSMSFVIG